ncbi:hypothetical protein HD554DRAFT_1519192 [Boletus coccyginus]|nr:hypothetical protein HD554DRAFT_1519192 [Boletus coccyginus]
MSSDPSNATSQTAPPPPKPSTSPPFADTVVRPFTSQGSSFGGSLQSPTYPYARPHSSDRHSTGRDSSVDPPNAKFGPYMSASARTSYTRVDVDSSPVPDYPPLPPLPTAFAVQDVPVATTPVPANDADSIPQTPQVSLTFLLVSGNRKTQTFEPETTVGRVKELVWNAWPARDADWQDERPPAPSYLRILYLGKVLQDDDTLLRVGFPAALPSASNATPTIVHLSIRPYGLPSDDPALSKKKRLSVAISRRLSSAGVAVGVGVGMGGVGRDIEREGEGEARRAGCCTGCTIC